MSFISTYNSASIRGWESEASVGANLQITQTIDSPVIANNYNFGYQISSSFDGDQLGIGSKGNTYVYANISNVYTSNLIVANSSNPKINGLGNCFISQKEANIGNVINVGSVVVYNKTANVWSLQQTLYPSTYFGNDNFGMLSGIDATGNTIIVASTQGSYGSVFVFVNSGGTYTETQKVLLTGPGFINIQDIGLNISGDGNYFIVGSANSGSYGYSDIYIRSGNTYSYQSRLQSLTNIGDNFGQSLSLNYDGAIALIGAPGTTVGANVNAGASYTFFRSGSTWTQQQQLISNKASANDFFGSSSFISSDASAIIVGAPSEDTGGLNRGSAFIYYNIGNTFYLSQELLGNAAANSDNFGAAVTLSNLTTQFRYVAAIGADLADISPRTNVGKVYIYTGVA